MVSGWDRKGTQLSDPAQHSRVMRGQPDPNAPKYGTPRRAARAFLNKHNRSSVSSNREATGFIVQLGKRQFTYTESSWNGLQYRIMDPEASDSWLEKGYFPHKEGGIGLNIAQNPAVTIVGTVHTHGAANRDTENRFTNVDWSYFEELHNQNPNINYHYLGLADGRMFEARFADFVGPRVRNGRPANPFSHWTIFEPNSIRFPSPGKYNLFTWATKRIPFVKLDK